jgi:hypothetical protein
VDSVTDGKESTEHARAWRAEAIGFGLVLAGLLLVMSLGWQAVAIVGIGAGLLGWTATSYMRARAIPKAAAERPRVLHAPEV